MNRIKKLDGRLGVARRLGAASFGPQAKSPRISAQQPKIGLKTRARPSPRP